MKKLIILITLLISTSAFAHEKSCSENTKNWIEKDKMIDHAIVDGKGKITILVNNDPYEQGEASVNHLILGWGPKLVKTLEDAGCKDPEFIPMYGPTILTGKVLYNDILKDWRENERYRAGAMYCTTKTTYTMKCHINYPMITRSVNADLRTN